MSSHIPDVPPPIRPPIASPPRSRPLGTPSIAEAGHFSKSQRPHVHRHYSMHRDKDKGRESNKDKEKDEKALYMTNSNPQTTLSPTGMETGTSRSENATPAQSQNASRRTSLLALSNADQNAAVASLRAEGKGSKEAELAQEREKGLLRASELRNELGNLNTQSNDTIRRLDNTYYSVLEKLGSLQNTIVSLKELAVMTRQLNEEFEIEAGKVAKEVGTSLDGFSSFEAQQKHIEELAGRVKAGKEEVKSLGGRVDRVRERVDGWERAEGEWQDRTRKRLRVMWIVMSVIAALMVGLSVFHYTPARTPGLDILSGLNISGVVGSVPEFEKLRSGAWSLRKNALDMMGNMSSCELDEEVLEEDPRLRLFDEL